MRRGEHGLQVEPELVDQDRQLAIRFEVTAGQDWDGVGAVHRREARRMGRSPLPLLSVFGRRCPSMAPSEQNAVGPGTARSVEAWDIASRRQ